MRASWLAILILTASICPGQQPQVDAVDRRVPTPTATRTGPNGTDRIELQHGHALIAYPHDHDPHTRYPLLIALHGTDTDANDIFAFWRHVRGSLPMILLAPQSGAAGWRESDTALLADVEAYLPTEPSFDCTRVFLAGHSAGGAMALHWTLAMGFSANAVVATANYVPPTVTAELAAARSDMPIFYAVGTFDLNHARMRSGARLLRTAGIDLTVHQPAIGHRLDQDVAQLAMRWIEQQARYIVDARLSAAESELGRDDAPGVALESIESLLADADAHFPDQIARANQMRTMAIAAVRPRLQSARRLADQGAPLAARQQLLDIERMYGSSTVAAEARRFRAEIEAHPKVAGILFHAVDVDSCSERPDVFAGR